MPPTTIRAISKATKSWLNPLLTGLGLCEPLRIAAGGALGFVAGYVGSIFSDRFTVLLRYSFGTTTLQTSNPVFLIADSLDVRHIAQPLVPRLPGPDVAIMDQAKHAGRAVARHGRRCL